MALVGHADLHASRLLAAAAAVLLAVIGCEGGEPPTTRPQPVTSVTKEFAASYPPEAPSNGVVRDYEIVAAPAEIPMFDGRMASVWAYNGQGPGPILRVRLGERLRVHFTNRLPEATTVHWHGVRVPNAMDGAPGVTQPPVQPGETHTPVLDAEPRTLGQCLAWIVIGAVPPSVLELLKARRQLARRTVPA